MKLITKFILINVVNVSLAVAITTWFTFARLGCAIVREGSPAGLAAYNQLQGGVIAVAALVAVLFSVVVGLLARRFISPIIDQVSGITERIHAHAGAIAMTMDQQSGFATQLSSSVVEISSTMEEFTSTASQIAQHSHDPEPEEPPAQPVMFADEDRAATIAAILSDMAAEPDCTFQPAAQLYQDFTVRCRMARIAADALDLAQFRRRFAMAVAGIADSAAPRWRAIVDLAGDVPDDLLAPFLVLAVAAEGGEACPDEDRLATVYGTRSPGRIRRLLEHLERQGLIVVRTDYGGRRSVGIPALGLLTQPG